MGWLPKVAVAVGLLHVGSDPACADRLMALGRHLAQECTSCHRSDGANNGIPSIVGLTAEYLIDVLQKYRTGERTNPTMVSVAQSLDDEQTKALAYYFSSLSKPGGTAAADKSGVAETR